MSTPELLRFLDSAPTSHHAARLIAGRLQERGFRRHARHEKLSLRARDAFFMEAYGTVLAVRLGTYDPASRGAVIAAAHTDSPTLQLKPHAARLADGLLRVPVEVYGGAILASWLDRELSIAGRVMLDGGDGTRETRLVHTQRPVAVIPNLAIHLDRSINEGLSYNRQDHLPALMAPAANAPEGVSAFDARLAELLGCDARQILASELALVPNAAATVLASAEAERELIVSPRIDNLAGCHAVLEALLGAAGDTDHMQVAVFFNHEEIGSATSVGAGGNLLRAVLERTLAAVGEASGAASGVESLDRFLARSVLLSNDASHARHPNYADRHDPGYAPQLGGGPVIKRSATWRYLTDFDVTGWFTRLCADAGIPVQHFQTRSDLPAGSTIGPAAASRLAVPGIDIGIPMLAMHASRETADGADVLAITRAIAAAYTTGPEPRI